MLKLAKQRQKQAKSGQFRPNPAFLTATQPLATQAQPGAPAHEP
jgi:hypothetical protein